jgi:hypothetical protein
MVVDVILGGEDAVGEPFVVYELPNILKRVQLGAFGWQSDNGDVADYDELAGRMPYRLINQHDRMSPKGDHERDLRQMQGGMVSLFVKRSHRPSALSMFQANRAEDTGRFCPLEHFSLK